MALSDPSGSFSLDAYSVTPVDAEAEGGKNITITFAPTSAGEKVATLVIKCGDIIHTVAITGTATSGS